MVALGWTLAVATDATAPDSAMKVIPAEVRVSSLAGSPSPSVRTAFEGLNQLESGRPHPPDVQLAAGPVQLVEMVNYAFAVYSKDGTRQVLLSLQDFFGTNATAFDPRVMYDAGSGRFYAAAGLYPIGKVAFSASASSDPTGSWYQYILNSSRSNAELPDQPHLGFSDDKIVVSSNTWTREVIGNFTYQAYAGVEYWVLNKAHVLEGRATPAIERFGPDNSIHMMTPAQSSSSTATLYMAADYLRSQSKLQIYAVTGVPGVGRGVSVSRSSVSIQALTTPPQAEQPDPSTRLDTASQTYEIQDADWYGNRLWVSQHVGCTPAGDTAQRSCLRLLQFNTAGKYSVAQQIEFGAAGKYYFYPAMAIDGQGNLAVVFGFSSPTEYPSVAVTGQAVGDPANSLKPPATLYAGQASDLDTRFGDYFGAGTDPSDPTTVWVAGQFNRTGAWSTAIGSMRVRDIVMFAEPSALSIVQGSFDTSRVDVASFGGFSGTVLLSTSVSGSGPTASLSASNVTLDPGSSGSVTVTINANDAAAADYTVTVTGAGGGLVSATTIALHITSAGGGGGGSVAYGTLITVEDGSLVPVQSIQIGDRLLGYNTSTGTFTVSVVESITVVDTTNMLVINTEAGIPLRVDANDRQTLWVMTAAGDVGWLPVTELQKGDSLLTVDGWVAVTSIEYAPAGHHVMYDLIATMPYFASGYLDPPIKE